jgi:hypothetical protein
VATESTAKTTSPESSVESLLGDIEGAGVLVTGGGVESAGLEGVAGCGVEVT